MGVTSRAGVGLGGDEWKNKICVCVGGGVVLVGGGSTKELDLICTIFLIFKVNQIFSLYFTPGFIFLCIVTFIILV